MKIQCPFCKSEIKNPTGGRCPICGHRINIPKKQGQTPKLWLAVALFFVTVMFSIISFRIFNQNQKSSFLTVSISDVKFSDTGYLVRGNIRNFSDRTYSIPDLVFVVKTDSGTILNRVKKLPPNGLIDPASDIEFIQTVTPKIVGAAKISVQFSEDAE